MEVARKFAGDDEQLEGRRKSDPLATGRSWHRLRTSGLVLWPGAASNGSVNRHRGWDCTRRRGACRPRGACNRHRGACRPALLQYPRSTRENCCCGMGNQRIDAADRPVSSAAAAGVERRATVAAELHATFAERRSIAFAERRALAIAERSPRGAPCIKPIVPGTSTALCPCYS